MASNRAVWLKQRSNPSAAGSSMLSTYQRRRNASPERAGRSYFSLMASDMSVAMTSTALPFSWAGLVSCSPPLSSLAQQYRCDTRCDLPLLERYQQLPFLQ